MPRRPRIQLDEVPLHIVQRGHNREPCFFGEDDYQSYLHWLGEALTANQCALHAYVLMTNHVHLLMTPKKAERVPNLIIALGRHYVRYINRTYRRTGTLWDSRYKSSLVHAESYLLTAMRYIELNPVRAAMVEDPAHYRWSSYRPNALGQMDSRLTPHPLYQELGATDKSRQAAYRQLLRAHLDAPAVDDMRLAELPENVRDAAVALTHDRHVDGQGLVQGRHGFGKAPAEAQHRSEIAQAFGDVRVPVTEHLAIERDRLAYDGLGLSGAPEVHGQEPTEVVEADRDARVLVAEPCSLERQRSPMQGPGFRQPAQPLQ